MAMFSRRLLAMLAGSAFASCSALLMQFALFVASPLHEYGTFAFIQVLQGLLIGVSSALFTAPLLSRQSAVVAPPRFNLGCYFGFQLLFVLLGGILVVLIASLFNLDTDTSLWLGLAVALHLWRWFARSLLQNNVKTQLLITSDVLFSLIALVGTLCLWGLGQLSLLHVAQLQVLAAASSLLLAGSSFWRQHRDIRQHWDLQVWRQGFAAQGKPALVGVVSAEAAANAHSYLITLIAGPAAFAPIAAAAMLFRPSALLLTNLAQWTRGQLQQLCHTGQPRTPMLRHFRQQSMLLWFGNTILLIALFLLLPASSLVWFSSKNISVTDFQLAVFLWSLLSLLRSLRSARTIELQVLDQFALLAKITLWPALLSVTLVFLGVLFWPAVWTILAVILSELWMAMLLNRAVSRFTS